MSMQHCAFNMVLICWYCINVTLGYTRTTVGCTLQSSGLYNIIIILHQLLLRYLLHIVHTYVQLSTVYGLYIASVLGVFRSQTVICGGTELEQMAV